ncbi:hypothetical protein B0O80DRAFT_303331 [Mortierella sp. GBAus27b]|nr:hypothetical protein B0O80DRAFT_303331 [Mortierella sp. GBAus27b]
MRQWHPFWARRWLVLFSLSLILFTLQRPLDPHAAPAIKHPAGRSLLESSQADHVRAQEHSLKSVRGLGGIGHSSKHDYQRRDVDESEDRDSDPLSSIDALPVSKVSPQGTSIASTLCNSDTTQVLGPGWNGTFSSNSQDGIYPSQTRSCTWTIQASPGDNGRSPNVIAINFTTNIQLVCGTDYLALYDGPDATATLLATICGSMWSPATPTYYSSGSHLTAVFTSRATSPGSYGFVASWTSVAPCSICVPAGRGSCSSANTCNCYSRYSGAVCEADTAGFKDFTPRSGHSMAYDPSKDMVYITGGTSLNQSLIWDMITYSFATNKWNKIPPYIKQPAARYGHYSFMYNKDLYIYGGISYRGGIVDLWKYNGTGWTMQQPSNPEKLPSGSAGPACVVVTNSNSTKLYVFGGLTLQGETTRDLNVYDMSK